MKNIFTFVAGAMSADTAESGGKSVYDHAPKDDGTGKAGPVLAVKKTF